MIILTFNVVYTKEQYLPRFSPHDMKSCSCIRLGANEFDQLGDGMEERLLKYLKKTRIIIHL